MTQLNFIFMGNHISTFDVIDQRSRYKPGSARENIFICYIGIDRVWRSNVAAFELTDITYVIAAQLRATSSVTVRGLQGCTSTFSNETEALLRPAFFPFAHGSSTCLIVVTIRSMSIVDVVRGLLRNAHADADAEADFITCMAVA